MKILYDLIMREDVPAIQEWITDQRVTAISQLVFYCFNEDEEANTVSISETQRIACDEINPILLGIAYGKSSSV